MLSHQDFENVTYESFASVPSDVIYTYIIPYIHPGQLCNLLPVCRSMHNIVIGSPQYIQVHKMQKLMKSLSILVISKIYTRPDFIFSPMNPLFTYLLPSRINSEHTDANMSSTLIIKMVDEAQEELYATIPTTCDTMFDLFILLGVPLAFILLLISELVFGT